MNFTAPDYDFGLIPFGSAVSDSGCDYEFEWYLDDQLIDSGKLPQLENAPTASWFIARLRALDTSIPTEINEENDGGGYCFEIAVASKESIVAAFQLQGDMEGVVALGRASNADTAERVHEQLVQLLLESPNELNECRYTIVDPEWMMDPECFTPTPNEDSRNEYGWCSGLYLGDRNIREQ